MREREQLFSEYIGELKRASKLKEEHHKHQSSKSRMDKVHMYSTAQYCLPVNCTHFSVDSVTTLNKCDVKTSKTRLAS